MDRSNDPRGGKEEGTRELNAPPVDAVVSEYRRLEHDSGRERGIVQRVKGEGGWSGDAGGGEFASRWGWRAGDCCVSEDGGGVYWEARRFRINLLKISPTCCDCIAQPADVEFDRGDTRRGEFASSNGPKGGGRMGGYYSHTSILNKSTF